MITTVTMNASLDKLYKVGRLRDGTVMRVSEVSNTAGGKGLNVAKVAALLDEKVTLRASLEASTAHMCGRCLRRLAWRTPSLTAASRPGRVST